MIKKHFLIVVFIFITLLSGSCTSVFLKDQTISDSADHQPITLELDQKLIQGSLDNGFRYFLYKNSNPQNRVSMHLNVLAGSINETEDQRGLAHYLEHMLFNGSTHFKPGELIEYFQSIGMDFGGDANAHTGFFETVYDLSLPQGDNQSIEKALIVMDDYARGALLLESEITRERGIILAEKRDRDSVSYRTFKASLAFELPGSIITKRYPIGTKKVINQANQDLLKDFYGSWYRPDNMMLVMVGDFDPIVVEDLIKNRFESFKPKGEKRSAPEIIWAKHSGIKTFYHYEPESSTTDITIETVSKVKIAIETLKDLKQKIKQDIADSILNNRLSRLLGKKESLFTDIGVYSGVYLKNIAFSSIAAKTGPDKWQQTLGTLELKLRQALIFGFTEKELERAKTEYINLLANRVKKSSTRKSENISASLLYHLNNKKIFQSPETRLKLLKPFIESLKIDSINNSFVHTWNKNQRLILITGNAKIGQNNEDAERLILEEFKNYTLRKVAKPKDSKEIKFPYLPELINPREIDNTEIAKLINMKKDFSGLGINSVDYKNGVRLNLKKTDFKKNEFLFNLAIKGGKATEPLQSPGISIVARRLINESGLGKVNREDLKEILAGTSVDINFDIQDEFFRFSGQAEPSELKLVFQLLYSFLKDPGFRQESLFLVKKRYEQDFNSSLRTPSGLMHIKGDRFLAGGNPRFGIPEIEQINKINIKSVQEWLKPFFENANIEISLVGDFDVETAEDLAGKYFGTLTNRNSSLLNFSAKNAPEFPANDRLELRINTQLNKSEVRLAFLTDDFWDISQTRSLNLLARVYSEQFRKIIREELGLAYSAYVYNAPSLVYDNYGILHAIVNGNPSQTDLILRNMQTITISLFKVGISKKELELARKPVLNHIRDMQKTNSYWLTSVLSGSYLHPEKFEWAKNIFLDYSSISHEEISLLAQKYLDLSKSAVIIIKPAN